MNTELNIRVFAVLKDYLEEEFTIEVSDNTVEGLKNQLILKNPEIQNILHSCRFAVNNVFISDSSSFKQNDTIYIIPPSSGG